MNKLGLSYLVLSAVLFAIAVVVHFNSRHLSLPISPVISILATILPIAGFLNAFVHPSLLYNTHHTSSSSPRLHRLAPLVLQTLQALITTILATLLMEATVPSAALSCVLENHWAGRYRAHDADTIRGIQDALSCCGLNSIKDRAYPFQKPGHSSTCADTYGRDTACKDPWRRAMQTNAGVDLAVVLAVGLLQIFGLLMMREGRNWWTAWRGLRWNQVMGEAETSRPLLTDHDDRHVVEEQDEEVDDHQGPSHQDYGSMGSGPRVEPSTRYENEWGSARGH